MGGVEAVLNGFHEGQGVAGGAPGIEGGKLYRAVEDDKGAAHFFEVGAQADERALQVFGGAFEAQPAKTRGVDERFPADMTGAGGAVEEFDDVREIRGESGDFGDGDFGRVGERPDLLTGVPSVRGSFRYFRGLAESAQLRGLRVEAGFRAFKENVRGRRSFIGKMRLQRSVREFGILQSEDEIAGGERLRRGDGKRARMVRDRMEAKDSAGDDAKSAESAGDEFGEVVAGDVFDDFAAAARERAIGKRDGDADDEVAERAETETERAAIVGGENAADGGLFRPERIDGEALAVPREGFLQSLDGAASFDGDGKVGPSVLEDVIQARSGKDEIGTGRRIAPGEFCAAAARDDGEAGFVRKAQEFGEFGFGAG